MAAHLYSSCGRDGHGTTWVFGNLMWRVLRLQLYKLCTLFYYGTRVPNLKVSQTHCEGAQSRFWICHLRQSAVEIGLFSLSIFRAPFSLFPSNLQHFTNASCVAEAFLPHLGPTCGCGEAGIESGQNNDNSHRYGWLRKEARKQSLFQEMKWSFHLSTHSLFSLPICSTLQMSLASWMRFCTISAEHVAAVKRG